ncbi:PREDICTED: protein EDS1L-like [Nelumbo nucifera]|uniref:Protein EDS1L-like n=1 Tax=Nelumbo nucifera TaxID=4432 RepID=A0A1U8AVE7_NELNU|nr:PREDICTED: protein EDS1L-like [Nelumbo nucifera]
MTTERRNLGVVTGMIMGEDLIQRACSLAINAHTAGRTYTLERQAYSSQVFFAFSGSWSVDDWFAQKSFGDSKVDLTLFPSLRSIGNDETAIVNRSFLRRFETVLRTTQFPKEVEKAVAENKQIVFTGHSSGGAVAVLATIWILENYRPEEKHNPTPPLCLTFGSPLVGDRVFGHALRRENWSRHFVHFVNRYDVVPRILLAPLPSIQRLLQTILNFFNPKSKYFHYEPLGKSLEATEFFGTVMTNALSVASHSACSFMGCTNLLLETVTSFVDLSPYRPCGTYIFCAGNKKLVALKNPDAVLQLMFYSLQLSPELEENIAEVAYKSLEGHLIYEAELQGSLAIQDAVDLDNLEKLPLSSEGAGSDLMRSIDIALNDLGLSARARLCLCAAGELEKQKLRNQAKIEGNRSKIEEGLKMLKGYRAKCEVRELGYYDAFKLQKDTEDFHANVKRLDLAGMWDEIVEMLKRYELPDNFEARKEWVELGTRFRRLVEPLDIANYYRHLKNEDTGPYMKRARPKRYRYTQRWLEHANRKEAGYYSESYLWARVEELCMATESKPLEEVKLMVSELEALILRGLEIGQIRRDVFLEKTTFVKWWKKHDPLFRSEAPTIAALMDGKARELPPVD